MHGVAAKEPVTPWEVHLVGPHAEKRATTGSDIFWTNATHSGRSVTSEVIVITSPFRVAGET